MTRLLSEGQGPPRVDPAFPSTRKPAFHARQCRRDHHDIQYKYGLRRSRLIKLAREDTRELAEELT